MKYKISLLPSPGAEYFTVREHHLNPQEKELFELDDLQERLRELLQLNPSFQMTLVSTEQLIAIENEYAFRSKDDPASGEDILLKGENPKAIDLSYSIPQIPKKLSDFKYIKLDPGKSLGIPVGFTVIFSKKSISTANAISPDKIDLFCRVMDDYLEKGIDALIRESNYKSAVLQHLIENSKHFEAIVEKKYSSKTIISATCEQSFIRQIESMGYDIHSEDYGQARSKIVIANYPTHSKELIEMFADRLMAL